MNRREDGKSAQRWAEAERLAAGLPSEEELSRNRRVWAFTVLAALILAALGVAAVFLLPQDVFGATAEVPYSLRTAGFIIEAAGMILGITIWVHAARTGQRPTLRGQVLVPLSLAQRRRIAHQIKGREPVEPEEKPVVLAAARQSLVAQRFSLRTLPAYFLFTMGNLLWTNWFLGKVLLLAALIMFVAVVPFLLRSLERTKNFLKNAGVHEPESSAQLKASDFSERDAKTWKRISLSLVLIGIVLGSIAGIAGAAGNTIVMPLVLPIAVLCLVFAAVIWMMFRKRNRQPRAKAQG